MIKPKMLLSPLAIWLFALSVASSANAATIVEDEITLSAMACQAALPVFDGQIRKRPLAIQNEGTSTAFITCAYRGRFGGTNATTGTSTYLGVGLLNNTGAPLSVTCTMVDGRTGMSNPINFVKSSTFSSRAEMSWSASGDNSGTPFYYPAVSCSLPPGTGIQYLARQYTVEIGS